MEKIRIAALGDSLTKGVVLNERNRYSILDKGFMDIVKDELDVVVNNYGKFGSTIRHGHDLLDRFHDEISMSDYTFLEYGGNDCDFDWDAISNDPDSEHEPKTLLESFKESFDGLVRRVIEAGSKPVIISLPPIISENYFSFLSRNMNGSQRTNVLKWLGGDVGAINRWHESYNQTLFQVAALADVPIIDATHPFYDNGSAKSEMFCSDGIHPNGAGHRLIASTVVNLFL